MAALIIESCHVACCANRTQNVLTWGRGGIIANRTCNYAALYDPKKGVVAVLNGHTGRVNTVQWVHREDCGDTETHLVSGGSDRLTDCHLWQRLQPRVFLGVTLLALHTCI
uniref:Elongator complex protein 2 n=1 Tax=Salmo trutta TaxID=8032 RepID=A0A674EEK9_SALTR